MPSKLPVVMSKKAIKAFSKAGWRVARQKGSHIHLVKPGEKVILTIPYHNKPLKRGVLRTPIKRAGLTIEEFVELL
ncbi:MAG: type II toxin-antitoxin system HicA family toxin [Candidatus Hydrothermarchaeales archaeon]